MRIVFLCGSLEPGKDGVGDYTRLLATEIQSHGHQVAIISMRDKYVAHDITPDDMPAIDEPIVLRFSSLFSTSESFLILKRFLAEFRPDFISLQYVPYSFSDRGTPVFLGRKLKALYSKCSWHVMVHEPFLSKKNKTLKKRLIRFLQIRSLRLLRKYLTPVVWHTSNKNYQQRLKRYVSIDCRLLHLFGNIPVLPIAEEQEAAAPELSSYTAVYFGAVPQPDHQPFFIDKLQQGFKGKAVKLQIIFCGKGGNGDANFHQLIKDCLPSRQLSVTVLGKLPTEELSHLFSRADFAVGRVFPHLVGKSGSAIAMLEHGLPLWLPLAKSEHYRMDIDFRAELCFKDVADIAFYKNTPKVAVKRLPIIAASFLKDLVSDTNQNTHASIRIGG